MMSPCAWRTIPLCVLIILYMSSNRSYRLSSLRCLPHMYMAIFYYVLCTLFYVLYFLNKFVFNYLLSTSGLNILIIALGFKNILPLLTQQKCL